MWLPPIFTFITACLISIVANISDKLNVFSLEDFIAHPSTKELDSLLKPQLRQVIQRLEIEHEENAKKTELKVILEYLVEEDLISDDKLDSASIEVEVRRLELEHTAREQEKQRECQLKLKELELREKEIAAKKELDIYKIK